MATMGAEAAMGLAGAGAASAASYFGQKSANKTNIRLAQENRDWQTAMSNTAYTRAVSDLKNAGLNPLLAVGAQASTPSGNMAQVENAAGKGASSALEAQRIHRENKAVDAQIANVNAQTAINVGNNKTAYATGELYLRNKGTVDKTVAELTSGSANAVKSKYQSLKDAWNNSYISKIGPHYSANDYIFEKNFERKNKK